MNALGEGWLLPAISTAVAVAAFVYTVARGVAARWRDPLTKEVSAHAETQQKLDAEKQTATEERVKRMFLEARLESCNRELDNWRAGRWSK